jgi:diguanylate cyclase (GGDEF)-like protein
LIICNLGCDCIELWLGSIEKKMTEFIPQGLSERTKHMAVLAASLALTPEAWGGVLVTVLEETHMPLAIKEAATGVYMYANTAMQALMGGYAQDWVDEQWLSAELCSAMRVADQSAMVQTVPQISQYRITPLGQNDKQEFSLTRLVLPCAVDDTPRYLCCLWTNLTEQRQLQTQYQLALKQLEALQQLTATSQQAKKNNANCADERSVRELYQRNQFEDQLRREVDLSSREHREFSLVSIALDALSKQAQQLGGSAQSRVLNALERLLRSNTRAMDALCQLDAGRFVVLLSGVGLATAHSRMEGLRRQCATQIIVLNAQKLGFSVSMGVASFPHTASTQAELLAAADAALVEAQRRGGNHVALASIRFEPSYF